MTDARDPALRLDALHERHVGLTVALAGTFFEAASVCLSRHHEPPTDVEIVRDHQKSRRTVAFQKPDIRLLNAWANEIDTTETGAYCMSLAALELEAQLVAIRRAETLSGADWYVAPIGTSPEDLERCYRLEVSGLDAGSRSAMDARLRQKVDQARRGASNLPAIAAVVGFKERAVAIQRVSNAE